jgi:hypothetical protein
MTHTLTNPTTAAALAALTRVAAAERAAYEDGHIDRFDQAAIEAAFERAWSAGATEEEAEHAYRMGIDWGYAAEHAE